MNELGALRACFCTVARVYLRCNVSALFSVVVGVYLATFWLLCRGCWHVGAGGVFVAVSLVWLFNSSFLQRVSAFKM